jgi:glycerophosphoryl diester phosphodiesterase
MEGLFKPWEYAQSIGASGLHPYYYAAKREIVLESQNCGIVVRPFTVNEKGVMQQLMIENYGFSRNSCTTKMIMNHFS